MLLQTNLGLIFFLVSLTLTRLLPYRIVCLFTAVQQLYVCITRIYSEGITGIDAARNDSRMSKLLKKPEFKDALRTVSEEQQLRESLPEPTARLYAEGKLMGPPKKLD